MLKSYGVGGGGGGGGGWPERKGGKLKWWCGGIGRTPPAVY